MLLLGIGNVLLGDDGLGPATIDALRAGWDFPPDVSLVDAGTPGAELAYLLAGAGLAILIDAVRADPTVGEVRRFAGEELRAAVPGRGGAHDPGLLQALARLELAGEAPGEVVLFGITIERAGELPGLSAAVAAALPALLEAVVAELAARGYRAVPRPAPPEPAPWWLRR